MYASLNSKLYTVASLREIATRMGLTVPSKSVKADIVALIVAGIDTAHAEAWDMNDDFDSSHTFTEQSDGSFTLVRPVASLSDRGEILARKVNAYMRQNGTDKLTPAQWRRVRKAMAKHAVTHTDMGRFYVYP